MGGESGARTEENFSFPHGLADHERMHAQFMCAPRHRAGDGDVLDVADQQGAGSIA